MDIENEIFALTTESLAFTAVLASVLGNIANTSPEMRTAIAGGFSDAASFVEHVAIMHGTRASPLQTVKAVQVVEELRTATLRD